MTSSAVEAREALATRVEVHSGDELGRLSGEFNRLMERLERHAAELERSNEDLRQFARDTWGATWTQQTLGF